MEKKKVTYTKEMKQQISMSDVFIGDVPGHQLSQYMRITSINYSDPDFGSSENLEYGQSDHIEGNGSHRGYSENNYKSGDKTFVKWGGTHKTIVKEDGVWEVNYEGNYSYTGGTGTFKNIKGGGVYKGTLTATAVTEEGEFEVEY